MNEVCMSRIKLLHLPSGTEVYFISDTYTGNKNLISGEHRVSSQEFQGIVDTFTNKKFDCKPKLHPDKHTEWVAAIYQSLLTAFCTDKLFTTEIATYYTVSEFIESKIYEFELTYE